MSEVTASSAVPLRTARAFNVVMIAGKITNIRRINADYYTRIAIAAVDEYSMPGAVEVKSSKPLGRKGEETTVECRLHGRPRRWTDRDSGEIVETADNWLVAVE